MEKKELFDALDGLFAYDSGFTDSGIHDETLRKRVSQELNESKTAYADLWRFLTERYTPDKGYTIEDAKEFISWLENHMDVWL